MSDRAADREREARIRGRGTTHWEGCWRSHPRCAEARVEKLEARVERYREALEDIADTIEEKGWLGYGTPGGTMLTQIHDRARRALHGGEDE